MKRTACAVVTVLIAIVALSAACCAETMWNLQEVNEIGYGIHPKVWADETDPDNRVTVEGVALAGFNEILNPNMMYTVFLQDDTSDRGGIQAWTGKFFYGDEMWALLRTTDYIDYQAGDRLRITGFIADMGRGKVVINNRGHSGSPLLVWHVEILGHSGLPDPELVPSVSRCNYFDHTRAGGGERYQTRYVMLHGVEVTSGQWGANNLMTVSDDTGSVGMLLSAMGDFNSNPQPGGRLNVVGVMDQEDDQVAPYADGYRVWVKRTSDIALALDACRQAGSADDGQRIALVNKVVSRGFGGFFYIQDPDRSGGVRVDSDRVVEPGDVVCVQGVAAGGGITANYLTVSGGGGAPRPLCVTSSALWGERGLGVDGLLVRVFGVMGDYVGDGIYNFTDDSGRTINVQTEGFALPDQGTQVILNAIAAVDGGVPMLLVAGEQDIQTVSQ